MPDDLGVWTADDCALVLIDYQNEMFEVILSRDNATSSTRPPRQQATKSPRATPDRRMLAR
jgi:nicotinamidase-related amidase